MSVYGSAVYGGTVDLDQMSVGLGNLTLGNSAGIRGKAIYTEGYLG